MKKNLLSLIVALVTVIGAQAQEVSYEWGTAQWNIDNARTFEDLDELEAAGGIQLTYPNPSGFTFTPFNVVNVDYDLYIDDAEEPVQASASGRNGEPVSFSYGWLEGHKYKIVTRGAQLVFVNIATHSTDILSSNEESYTIEFTVNGSVLVKTIEVEAYQSLAIEDQEADLTYALVPVQEIVDLLGINDISEARVTGVNPNGTYNDYFRSYYDGWHDYNGLYTFYNGGWDPYQGRNNAAPVYSVKLSENSDSLYFFFFDRWTEYDPSTAGEETIEGGSVAPASAKRRASVIWDWDNGDGTVTQYTRSYRVEEGSDYKGSFAFIANKKVVQLDGILHFVSVEDYKAYLETKDKKVYNGVLAESAVLRSSSTFLGSASEEQTVTVANPEDGVTSITFSGINYVGTVVPFPVSIPEFTVENVAVTENADGSIFYSAGGFYVGEGMVLYQGTLVGTQASADATPVITLVLNNATQLTTVFAATAEEAAQALEVAVAIRGVEAASAASAGKRLENGKLVIYRNGVKYNAAGLVVE